MRRERMKRFCFKIVSCAVSVALISSICVKIKDFGPSLYKLTGFATSLSNSMNFLGSKDNNLSQNQSDNTITDKIETPDGSIWEVEIMPEEDKSPSSPSKDDEKPSENEPLPYPFTQENNDGVIKRLTYTTYTDSYYFNLKNGGQVRNCTTVSNTLLLEESEKRPEFKIELNSEPQVLIMHTHTTESYEPYSRDFYDNSFISRTTDNTMNVVAVGNRIVKELERQGISAIQSDVIHDYPTYSGSYQRSKKTVEEILAEYPSIKVVLDIHRDALITKDNVRLAPVKTVNGRDAAQIMIISGCDDGTMGMPNYMKNFRLASMIQSALENEAPGITRPVLFDYRNYNQQLTTGSLLIEIGTHGNSIDEALYSGEIFGKALAKVLIELSK